MSNKSTVEKFAVGAAIAGAIGYVVGLLTAPKSGKQTRTKIKREADVKARELENQLKDLHMELGKVVDSVQAEAGKKAASGRSKLDQSVTTATVAKDKVRELLSAIRNGEADDSELDNAIKDAKQALESLKDYLKK